MNQHHVAEEKKKAKSAGASGADDGGLVDEEFFASMKDLWQTASEHDYGIVCKDVPRLVRRVTVEVHDPANPDFKRTELVVRDVGNLAPLSQVLLTVVEALETPEVFQEATKFMDDLDLKRLSAGDDTQVDFVSEFRGLFGGCLLGSKSVKVLQCIHQKIIIACLGRLRRTALKDVEMTKDVRGAEGWRITVDVNRLGNISVTHLRKEQSMNDEKDDRHWTFAWEVRMGFDKEMEDLRAVFLRITDLQFNPGAPQDFKDDLTHKLTGGSMIIQ